MKRIFLVLFLVYLADMGMAQDRGVPVFISGTEGYKSFRIPAIIRLPQGHLLAFCEGRKNNSSDFGDIDIVMRRSFDDGWTWDSIRIVVDHGVLQAGNPAPVFDITDPLFPKGRIFLFYNTGDNHESEIRKGRGIREVWYKTSMDGGENWSEPVNITLQVHRPKQPGIDAHYNFKEDWRSYANTPGHAMQFKSGSYRGRIFIAANHSSGEPKQHFEDYQSHGFYTDDHGRSFHLSDDILFPGSNEAMAAELWGGRLMMNMRNQGGNVKARIVSISSNGGAKWDTVFVDNHLPDPVCQGSILDIGSRKRKNILAFCNPADTMARNNLSLRISFDDGKDWTKKFTIKNDPGKRDPSAYSDMVKLNDREIGILYEKDNYSEIYFTTVKWK